LTLNPAVVGDHFIFTGEDSAEIGESQSTSEEDQEQDTQEEYGRDG
jgi:hypothetical protein